MPVTRLQQLRDLGQSVWIDNLSRSMINTGELQRYIDLGVVGVTSNPTIFVQSISSSDAYDDQIRRFQREGLNSIEMCEELAISDARRACDMLRTTFQRTRGVDGYVSILMSPMTAFDSQAILAGARRLRAAVDRPNIMVKIPATGPGIAAIGEALYEGINVNVTSLFSVDTYEEVVETYIDALERRLDAGEPIDRIASVASFLVRPVDAEVDCHLQAIVDQDSGSHAGMLAGCLLGTIGIANARVAYSMFRKAFEDERFARLRRAGGRLQRPLWAGTTPMNPGYPANLYTEALIGPDTVSTMTVDTIQNFLANGKRERTVDMRLDEAFHALASLEELGISYPDINQRLIEQGIASFTESYRSLLDRLEHSRKGVIDVNLDPVPHHISSHV